MSPVQCFSLLTTLQNSTGHILSGSVPEGVNTWAVFKYIFHLPLEGLKSACWPFKALQSNISHPTLLSHWVQTAFVTSTQQGFSLASVSTRHSTWLAASTTNQFLFARSLS